MHRLRRQTVLSRLFDRIMNPRHRHHRGHGREHVAALFDRIGALELLASIS